MAKLFFSKDKKNKIMSSIKGLEEQNKQLQNSNNQVIVEYEKQLKEKDNIIMAKPPASRLDFHQVLQHAFNEESGSLRVEGKLNDNLEALLTKVDFTPLLNQLEQNSESLNTQNELLNKQNVILKRIQYALFSSLGIFILLHFIK